MDIRQVKKEDAQAFRRLRIEALTNNPEAFATRLTDALTQPIEKTEQNLSLAHAFTVGAFSSGLLIGNATLVRNLTPKLHHRATIVAMYVRANVRGQGIATHVMNHLFTIAQSWQGVERLDLAVASENLAAIALYEKLGFKTYGIDVKAMKDHDHYTDEKLMMKFL